MLFLKKNKLIIIVFTVLLLFTGYNVLETVNEFNNIYRSENKFLDFCRETQDEEYKEVCDKALNKEPLHLDFFYAFSNIMIFGYRNVFAFISLIALIPGIYYISRVFKNNILENMLTREKYKSAIRKIFTKAYLTTLIFPIIISLVFLFCYFYTGGFSITNSITGTGWSIETLSHPIAFIFLYLINILICGMLYVSVGLCITRKYHNYFVSLILSYLSVLGIELFLEIFVGAFIMSYVFHDGYSVLISIMNPLSFTDSNGMLGMMICPSIFLGLSAILLYFLYRDKEKLIIDCEKNN